MLPRQLLQNPESLRQLYHANLFDPLLIQTLQLIPSEYLFFYYSQRKAYRNQLRAGASRGEEFCRLNGDLFTQLQSEAPREGLNTYRNYLMQRNSSYMRLEAEAGSAFSEGPGRNRSVRNCDRVPPHCHRGDDRSAVRKAQAGSRKRTQSRQH